jgi:NAD dependent epimerase/dehydratase
LPNRAIRVPEVNKSQIKILRKENQIVNSNFWQDKRVLVTGAGGFIASHLVETLLQAGARLRAFVRYNSRADPGLLNMLPNRRSSHLEIFYGDLLSQESANEAMRDISHVFHLGALIAIPYSYHHPQEVVYTNIIGTLNILLAARDLGIQRLVHTSTSEVYGTALITPIDEGHPLQAQSPYSASKIGADKLAESFYCAYNLPVVTLRPFNTYGPRQSTRAIIPTIITQALTQDVVNLGNLHARRDLTYISDTVRGFLRVAEAQGVEGKTFNLGTGSEVTIAELAKIIIDQIGRPVNIKVDTSRLRPENSEVQRLIADNTFAKQRLAWSPRVSLEKGLAATIAWYKDHIHLYQPGKYQL